MGHESTQTKGGRLKVLCVKTGDKYGMHHVRLLNSMVSRHLSMPFDFVCYTDVETDEFFCELTPFPGWWGKISLFGEVHCPCLFLDLDTVVVRSLDPLAEAVMGEGPPVLYLLAPFKSGEKGWQSGIMAWRGNWSFILSDYTNFNVPLKYRKFFRGDQDYITHVVGTIRDLDVRSVQSVLPGVYSYKVHVRGNGGPPGDTSVVCFHGRPRPEEVYERWIEEHWR